jgi:hypothetical protein
MAKVSSHVHNGKSARILEPEQKLYHSSFSTQRKEPRKRHPMASQTFEKESISRNLLLGSLDSGLGDLASLVNLDNGLDDTDGDGLSHVTDGETSEGRVFSESLNAHRLGGNHLDNSSITGFDELRRSLSGFTSTTIDLLDELGELASNVRSVAIQDRGVAVADLTGVVHEDDLGVERLSTLGGVVLGVTSNVATTDLLDRDVLTYLLDLAK